MKLSDICEVYSGFAFKQFNDKGTGYKVIKIGNILNNGEVDTNNCVFSDENVNSKYISKSGDILVALSGATTGKVGIIKENGFLINQRVGIVRLKRDDIPQTFIYYFLKNKTNQILNDALGAAQPNISPKEIANYEINIDLDIFNSSLVLEKMDECIKTKEKQFTLLNELALSKFAEMFGDINLFDEKDEWISISDLCDVYTGTTPKSDDDKNWNGDILWITPAELDSDSFYVFDTVRKITEIGKKSKSLDLMPINTVLLSTRAPIGKVAIVGKEMCCNQGFKNLKCNSRLNHVYLYFLLKQNNEYLNSLGSGTTFMELSKSKILDIKIPVPSLKEQEQFADFIVSVENIKNKLKQEIKNLKQFFEYKMFSIFDV